MLLLTLTTMLWLSIFVGATAATAALYGRYKILPAFFTGPTVCQLEAGGCNALFRTKEAQLLGLPNALLGIVLYLLLAIGLLANWSTLFLVLLATFGLLMSIHLGWYLLKNHLQCRICWAGHIANAAIWLGLSARLFISGG